MKIWKLVSGILSIIFFALVAMQSCAVGVANTLEDSGEVSSSAGILVAVTYVSRWDRLHRNQRHQKNGAVTSHFWFYSDWPHCLGFPTTEVTPIWQSGPDGV